jgi:transcriptional regulator CBF1
MAAVHNKRKRSSQDMGAARAAPGMTQPASTEYQHYIQADDGNMEESIDFSAMVNNSQDVPEGGDVQHSAGHLQSQGQQGGQENNDTAAAAMAQFHTMTVPQSTESTFLNTAGEGGDGQAPGEGGAGGQRTSSFGAEFDTSAVQGSPNGEGSPTGLGPNSSKPAVGSDEWHKIRKDNHKEGKCIAVCFSLRLIR